MRTVIGVARASLLIPLVALAACGLVAGRLIPTFAGYVAVMCALIAGVALAAAVRLRTGWGRAGAALLVAICAAAAIWQAAELTQERAPMAPAELPAPAHTQRI